jgi:MFS superfamily sulfate permease-like transporter
VVLGPESGLFFANADAVRRAVQARVVDGTRAVVLDAATVPAIDVTATSMLLELAAELRREGVELVLARDVGAVRDLVRLGSDEEEIRSFPTVQTAVDELTKGSRDGPSNR